MDYSHLRNVPGFNTRVRNTQQWNGWCNTPAVGPGPCTFCTFLHIRD